MRKYFETLSNANGTASAWRHPNSLPLLMGRKKGARHISGGRDKKRSLSSSKRTKMETNKSHSTIKWLQSSIRISILLHINAIGSIIHTTSARAHMSVYVVETYIRSTFLPGTVPKCRTKAKTNVGCMHGSDGMDERTIILYGCRWFVATIFHSLFHVQPFG